MATTTDLSTSSTGHPYPLYPYPIHPHPSVYPCHPHFYYPPPGFYRCPCYGFYPYPSYPSYSLRDPSLPIDLSVPPPPGFVVPTLYQQSVMNIPIHPPSIHPPSIHPTSIHPPSIHPTSIHPPSIHPTSICLSITVIIHTMATRVPHPELDGDNTAVTKDSFEPLFGYINYVTRLSILLSCLYCLEPEPPPSLHPDHLPSQEIMTLIPLLMIF